MFKRYEIQDHLDVCDINIAGEPYRLRIVGPDDVPSEDAVGEACYHDKTLYVAHAFTSEHLLCDSKTQEVLLHELAHAWMEQTGNTDLNDERHAELLSYFARFVLLTVDNDMLDWVYGQQKRLRDSEL